MKTSRIFLVMSLIVGITSTSNGQLKDKLAIGFKTGGQKLYSDLANTNIGWAGDILVNYRIDSKLSFIFSVGYGQFKENLEQRHWDFPLVRKKIITRIIPWELKGIFKPYPYRKIAPFVSLGIGAFLFKVDNPPPTVNYLRNFHADGFLAIGGGIAMPLKDRWELDFSGDFHFTTGDDLDATRTIYSKTKDAYLTGKIGLIYYFEKLEERRLREKPGVPTEIIAALNKLGIGFNIGGQKLYCDLPSTNTGPSFDLSASYEITPTISLILSGGYGQFRENLPGTKIKTEIIPFDLKGSYNLFPQNNISPYVLLGLGTFGYKVNSSPYNWEGSFIGGGGIEVSLNEHLGLNISAEYHLTTSDNLDATHDPKYSKANDGFLTSKVGLTYYFKRPEKEKIREKPILPIEIIAAAKEKEKKAAKDVFLRVIELRSTIDKLNKDLEQRQKEADQLKALMAQKDEKIKELNDKLASYKAYEPALKKRLSNVEYKRRYSMGLEKFNARQYRQAIEIFEELLSSNPDHALASNCYYWIGESYNGLGRLSEAIAAFEKVLNYKRSFKKDDALLMQGVCYLKQGNRTKAKEFFNRLIELYPNSEYVTKATGYLQRLSSTEISLR